MVKPNQPRHRELTHQDDHDDGWARRRARFSIRSLKELPSVNSVKGLDVLVLGCGMGYECEEWKNLDNRVTACDMKEKYVKNARKYSDKTFFCDLMENIKQKDRSFDVVYCSETFEHLLSPQPFIGECNRVLKRNGYLVLTTDNPCNAKNIMRMLRQDSRYFHKDGHNQFCSPKDMKRLLERNGFRVLKTKNIGRWRFASLGDVYMMIARKA